MWLYPAPGHSEPGLPVHGGRPLPEEGGRQGSHLQPHVQDAELPQADAGGGSGHCLVHPGQHPVREPAQPQGPYHHHRRAVAVSPAQLRVVTL